MQCSLSQRHAGTVLSTSHRLTRSSPAPCFRPSSQPRHRTVACLSVLDGFVGLSSLLRPEVAAMFSAVLAASSVGLNYYGSLLTENKRVELQKEVEREKQFRQQTLELQGIIARYRGPLLESSIDLEQRLYHLATMTGEWYHTSEEPCYEEITYTMFTMAQLLGFIEVVRREGPRETSFLQVGSPQGSDTLSTLVEGIRYVMTASPATFQAWASDEVIDHPGARHRNPYIPRKGKRRAMLESSVGDVVPLRLSRGRQRAIGSLMVATPMGAERHYTRSYAEFMHMLATNSEFAEWMQPIEADLVTLLTGPSWMGAPALPPHRWTRVLLLQQLLVDAIDLLDPDYVRVPKSRRVRLMPVAYRAMPNVESYKAALSALYASLNAYAQTPHFTALQDLMKPAAADGRLPGQQQQQQGLRSPFGSLGTTSGSQDGSSPGSSSPGSSSPGSSEEGDVSGPGEDGLPIIPREVLPVFGVSGVVLKEEANGRTFPKQQGGEAQQQQQQQQEGSKAEAAKAVAAAAGAGTARKSASE